MGYDPKESGCCESRELVDLGHGVLIDPLEVSLIHHNSIVLKSGHSQMLTAAQMEKLRGAMKDKGVAP
jgi:hypothetical protein